MPTGPELLALIAVGLCGGIAHILLTESYRLAPPHHDVDFLVILN